MANLYSGRKRRNVIWTGLAYAATVLGLSMLVIILATLLWNGFGGLSLDVFTKNTAPPGVVGGLLNSIRRQPDHDRDRPRDRRAAGHSGGHLSGRVRSRHAPRHGRSLHQRHSAQRALDRRRPVHLRAVRRARSGISRPSRAASRSPCSARRSWCAPRRTCSISCPNTLREAASALGMPRSLVIRHIAYKAVRSGIVTGVLLAIARMTGETAPLIFTALGNSLFTLDPRGPMSSPSADHLRVRPQPLRRAAEARMDGRAPSHLLGAGPEHRGACALRPAKQK